MILIFSVPCVRSDAVDMAMASKVRKCVFRVWCWCHQNDTTQTTYGNGVRDNLGYANSPFVLACYQEIPRRGPILFFLWRGYVPMLLTWPWHPRYGSACSAFGLGVTTTTAHKRRMATAFASTLVTQIPISF